MSSHDPSSQIIFVRGIMPRSGTNFMADALACHPALARFPGSFWEFPPFRSQTLLNEYLQRVESSPHAPEFRAKEFLPTIGSAWMDYLTRAMAPGLRPLFKEPSIAHLEEMFSMFPEAKTVIMVRDGRDLIESLLKAGFGLPPRSIRDPHSWRRFLPDEDFRILCRQLAEAVRELTEFQSAAAPFEDRFRIVRFEELFSRTDETLDSIISWLGLPPDSFDREALHSLPVRGSSFLRRKDGSMNFEKGETPSGDFNPVGRSAAWSKNRHACYDRIVGSVFQQWGYDR